MNFRHPLAAALLLISFAAAAADTPPVIITDTGMPAGSSDKTINIRTDGGSSCTALAAGLCGSCAISCPVGKAAVCKPGKVIGPNGQAQSCLEPPSCKCE